MHDELLLNNVNIFKVINKFILQVHFDYSHPHQKLILGSTLFPCIKSKLCL